MVQMGDDLDGLAGLVIIVWTGRGAGEDLLRGLGD